MKQRALNRFTTCIFFILLILSSSFSQEMASNTGVEFNAALRKYVKQLLTGFGKDALSRERFLVQQIRMINEEIKSRVGNVEEIRNNYFDRLENRRSEIQALKQRLAVSRSTSLNQFVDELDEKIRQTIASGTIDFKRQKVIEDAIQLLYIAEEMIKLDPNARLEDSPEIRERLSQSRTKFTQTFGDQIAAGGTSQEGSSLSDATIFDVYEEWNRTERIKYQVRWTDIQIIKNRLIKNGTRDQKDQMLQRELLHASEMFNFGYYDLSESSFEEVLSRYTFSDNLDDVLYYKGEANFILGRYNHAREDFGKLVRVNPSSSFVSRAYKRLMQIEYHYDNYSQVLGHLRSMRAIVSSTDTELEQSLLIAAISALKGGLFEEAVSNALEITNRSTYYKQARFILAEAYAGAQNYDEAANVFRSILQISGLRPGFRFMVLMKLGYISFELGDYDGAITQFNEIAGSFKRYDRVLIGYGWSYYKRELNKPKTADHDFTFAKKYLETLLDYFYGSDYYLEAKTLLGYIYQLEENVSKALQNYEYSFNAKEVKLLSDRMNHEREELKKVYNEANSLEKESLKRNNITTFQRARAMKGKIGRPLRELTYSDLSSGSVAVKNEMQRLKKQLAELDRLKVVAQERQRDDLVDRIETMQLKIYRAVNEIPVGQALPFGVNYFDEHPLARKESIMEHENKKILKSRSESQSQYEEVLARLAKLDVEIQNARARKDYNKMIHLELSRDRFLALAKSFDFLETQAFSFDIYSSYIGLDRWSDYGAFGMANVNFAIRKMKSKQVAFMQKQISEINEILETRKNKIDHKISQIEDEITLMTRQVRRQERLREREELERQFKETYFDTHDTELDYTPDTSAPPKIEDDSEE